MSYYKTIKGGKRFQGGGISPISFTPIVPKTAAWKKAEDAYVADALMRKSEAEDAAARASFVELETQPGNIAAALGASTVAKKAPKTVSKPTVKKDTPQEARIKYIQRRLGVKADGIWGNKTEAAFKAMKETQKSLGFTGKDVDGIRGVKTTAAIAKRDSAVLEAITPLVTTSSPIDQQLPMRVARKPLSNREMRQDAREVRKVERADRRADRAAARARTALVEEFDIRRRGGIFYNTID